MALLVSLMTHTPSPFMVAAIAARRCYSGDSNPDLFAKVVSRDERGFLTKVMESGHTTVIEHAAFTFLVEGVSRSLLAQITRHRIASFSVQSQRYVEADQFEYVIPPSIEALGMDAVERFEAQMGIIQGWYDDWVQALGGGRDAYEDARYVLPNAAETKFVVTMNARELLHFFTMRCCNRAQWEIRGLAEKMLQLVKERDPIIFANAGPACLRGPCPEGKMSCGKSKEVRKKYSE